MHEVLVNRLGGLSLPRKSVVRLTDRPDMTLDVYRGRKTTIQQQQQVSYVYVAVYRKCSIIVGTSEKCIETVKIELFQSSRLSKMTKSVDPDQTAPGAV